MTSSWNVNKIDNYSYINNAGGTSKTYGYQKLDIKNGVLTITRQNGNITQITGDTKARLLSVEETLDLVSNLNPNLSEDN